MIPDNKLPYMVVLTEHERGWGQREYHREYFDTLEAAMEYSVETNAKNNLPYVPDWYVTASEPLINPQAKGF